MKFKELVINIQLGLGWLRAVAQGYNYNCIQRDLVSNFQRNLTSCGIKFSGAWMAARDDARLQLQLQ